MWKCEAGIYRLALAVEDATASYRHLLALGAGCSLPAPLWLRFKPEVPVADVWTLCGRDPDGTCAELIQTPEF